MKIYEADESFSWIVIHMTIMGEENVKIQLN